MQMNIFIVFLFSLTYSAISQPHIIPQPRTIDITSSTENDGWAIQNNMQIGYDPSIPDISDFVNYVANALKTPTGFNFQIISQNVQTGLYFGKHAGEDNEYLLTTTNDLATISGADKTALFYGFQTLLQLLPPSIYSNKAETAEWIAKPLVSISDYPKFSWRGVMVDTSRHFFPIAVLKQLIDGMSHYKLNSLHLHLSDDQGWRLQINKYPNLTKYGSVRDSSPKKWDRYISDNTQYGPYFYTESEISELVNYASQKMVTIIPEIQMPGHAMSILSSFPQHACTSNEGPFKPSCFWGTNDDCVLCVGNDEMIDILEDVLEEVIRIFSIKPQNRRKMNKNLPSAFLHIGGNDASLKKWKTCNRCNERIDNENLSSVDQLHSWFLSRISRFLFERNVRVVGCDSLIDSKGYSFYDIPQNAVVMSWRSNGGARVAAKLGHDVVMSPSDRLYLDYSQFNAADFYEYMGESVTAKMVYHYDPLEDFDDDEEELKKFVIGAEASLWSQFIFDENDFFYKSFPRLVALAETVWCEKETKDWERFMRFVDRSHIDKLRAMGFDATKVTNDPSCAQLSFSRDGFDTASWQKDEFPTKYISVDLPVDGAFNKYGFYEIAFIHMSGENALKMKNVKLLVNNVVVGEDNHEGSAGEVGVNNIYSVYVGTSPGETDIITLQAEVMCDGGTDTEGRIHIYQADLRN